MTADERIEGLLNRFGQTMEDLPKPDGKYFVYLDDEKGEHQKAAGKAVFNWQGIDNAVDVIDLLRMHQDYICHLADVIDRMEAALETAVIVAECSACENYNKEDAQCCSYFRDCFRISDELLADPDFRTHEEDEK